MPLYCSSTEFILKVLPLHLSMSIETESDATKKDSVDTVLKKSQNVFTKHSAMISERSGAVMAQNSSGILF